MQCQSKFLSTLSLRRATTFNPPIKPFKISISIHALLAESDILPGRLGFLSFHFYPRSPCGERPTTIITICIARRFLSTLSLRRATPRAAHEAVLAAISIHALLAESDIRQSKEKPRQTNFYPRSPCGERRFSTFLQIRAALFLSTLSLRRATRYDNYNLHCTEISIHALLAESDITRTRMPIGCVYFYPRSPCGERLPDFTHLPGTLPFLSTLSLRRATNINGSVATADKISIHALLAESDISGFKHR